ncbi:MAG: hypothetical protein V1743_02975 [Nanoarchaeota archaeon]
MQIGKVSIKPTRHYLEEHAEVEWDMVISTILSPSKTHPNLRLGKDRFTYIKKFKKYMIEVHTRNDELTGTVWIINAFKIMRRP